VEKEPSPYKPTMFDRHGPAAGDRLRAFAYGLTVFAITLAALIFTLGQGSARLPWWITLLLLLAPVVAGAIVSAIALGLSSAAGATYKHLMVSGSTTPYKEQYSYQQTLVMQGRLDDALESFEAVIAEKPESVDARVKAAELYARDKANFVRAAELFREIQRIPTVTTGEDIYATNRLVDLLTGPLQNPGRALVELRRLIERYPGSAAAVHARGALADLKARFEIRE
jgi:tetratricopeptide (TPR) repeat protein